MRVAKLKVENHRRLQDFEIEVREHLVLVGANDVGKSSILRLFDLVLGSSTAHLYANVSSEDFRVSDQPFIVEVTLDTFSDDDIGLFPDEIHIDPSTKCAHLTIRLSATVDDNETVTIERTAITGNTGRQLSRDQVAGLGWKFLSATSQVRDLRDNRKSALDDILETVDLGSERETFEAFAENFAGSLKDSKVLEDLRDSLAAQLSRALPEAIEKDELAFVPGAAADNDVLSDVRLQVTKGGRPRDLSEQSDGTRALYAIALYDLMSEGASVVGIDEPEIHLHPSSQRSLARLLKVGKNQKILATHSPDIVGTFDPDCVVVVRVGGEVVQPDGGFLSNNERLTVRMWVRDRLEPLTSKRVVIVEGISDRILLEHLAEVSNRSLDRLGVSILEAGGAGDMGPFQKLFGDGGFKVPMSRLIDEDAQQEVANQLKIKVEDLEVKSVWTSKADLEDEYVRALGKDVVWAALQSKGHFSQNELKNCPATGVNGERTESDIASFCRGLAKKKSSYKVNAALSVLSLFTAENAASVTSIESLLNEIAV